MTTGGGVTAASPGHSSLHQESKPPDIPHGLVICERLWTSLGCSSS